MVEKQKRIFSLNIFRIHMTTKARHSNNGELKNQSNPNI